MLGRVDTPCGVVRRERVWWDRRLRSRDVAVMLAVLGGEEGRRVQGGGLGSEAIVGLTMGRSDGEVCGDGLCAEDLGTAWSFGVACHFRPAYIPGT